MKIVAYGSEDERLIKFIFSYLKKNKCKNLNIKNLKCIKVDDEKCGKGVNARYCHGTIYIDKKAIKPILEKNNIHAMENNSSELLKNDDIKILMNDLLHELFHCDAEIKMPMLHNMVYDEKCDFWKRITAHFWIESYVGYCSSQKQYHLEEQYRNDIKLLHQIVEVKWNITNLYRNENNLNNMSHLEYIASYFVPLILSYDLENEYLPKIGDDNIRKLFEKLIMEVKYLLEVGVVVEEYNKIERLEMFFKEYYNKIF